MARRHAAKQPEPPPPGPPMTDAERAELDARLARLFSKPLKSELPGGRFFLLWVARDDAGSPRTMVWNPETPEELRGANLFYDAAHGFGAFAKPVKKGKPLPRTAEHKALIAGILADRDDDTGYLVYADYLTERGDPQGDYIRLHVELNRLPPGHPDAADINRRINELSAAHAEEWYAPLGELGLRPEFQGAFIPWSWMSLEHGVIEEATIDRPGIFPRHADRLFAAAPFLRKLAFEQGHLDPAALAKTEQLEQIEELDLYRTALDADGLRALLRSKHLTALKRLTVGSNALGDEGARALAAWPGLAKLESLDTASGGLSDTGIAAIVNSPNAAHLKRLRIGSNPAGGDGVRAVLESRHLKSLAELSLGQMAFFTETAGSFARAAFAKTLTSLDLDGAAFEPGAFEALAACKLPALTSLKLNGVPLRAADAANLAGAAWRGTLTELHLDLCQLAGAGAEALAAGRFPRLAKLELSRNNLGTRGGVALAGAAKAFPALTYLRLWDDALTPVAAAALAASPVLANVTELDLNGNKIGPAGAHALAKSKHMTKLTSLVVDAKTVGKRGKQALVDRFGEGVVSFR